MNPGETANVVSPFLAELRSPGAKASRICQHLLADPTVGVGVDLNGTFISAGGNQIGDALGSNGFLNRRLSDRVR